MYDPELKLQLVRASRVCGPVDKFMNHVFGLDSATGRGPGGLRKFIIKRRDI
jgi:hypothetical protein